MRVAGVSLFLSGLNSFIFRVYCELTDSRFRSRTEEEEARSEDGFKGFKFYPVHSFEPDIGSGRLGAKGRRK